jgi:hypothetical protein
VGLLTQSPSFGVSELSIGRQGMLAMMASLHCLFNAWWIMPSSARLFQV